MVFADVLNQINLEQLPPTQQNFRQRLLNHTFHTNSRTVSIGSDAYRLENILFNRFNGTSKTFQTGWMYNAASRRIDTVSEVVADRWHGRADPLPNKPACGYRGELCYSDVLTRSTLSFVIAACLLVVFSILTYIVFHTLQ